MRAHTHTHTHTVQTDRGNGQCQGVSSEHGRLLLRVFLQNTTNFLCVCVSSQHRVLLLCAFPFNMVNCICVRFLYTCFKLFKYWRCGCMLSYMILNCAIFSVAVFQPICKLLRLSRCSWNSCCKRLHITAKYYYYLSLYHSDKFHLKQSKSSHHDYCIGLQFTKFTFKGLIKYYCIVL